MAINYPALKTELLLAAYNTPRNAGDHLGCAALLNAVSGGITIRRSDLSPADIYSQIDTADMIALPGSPTAAQLSDERRKIGWLTGIASVSGVRLQNDNGTDTPITTMAKAIFTNGSGTLTRLNALATRNGSRAEQLFGAGTVVGASDVAIALAL
jgi:hypothetical protein